MTWQSRRKNQRRGRSATSRLDTYFLIVTSELCNIPSVSAAAAHFQNVFTKTRHFNVFPRRLREIQPDAESFGYYLFYWNDAILDVDVSFRNGSVFGLLTYRRSWNTNSFAERNRIHLTGELSKV